MYVSPLVFVRRGDAMRAGAFNGPAASFAGDLVKDQDGTNLTTTLLPSRDNWLRRSECRCESQDIRTSHSLLRFIVLLARCGNFTKNLLTYEEDFCISLRPSGWGFLPRAPGSRTSRQPHQFHLVLQGYNPMAIFFVCPAWSGLLDGGGSGRPGRNGDPDQCMEPRAR